MVNREFARKVFGSITGAVGGSFKAPDGQRFEVVGVVENGKYETLTEDAWPAYFKPILQSPATATWLVVRSNGDSPQLPADLHKTLRGLDPGLPLTVMTWQKQLDSALFAARMATISLGVLGILGAMLAVTGIFGMASYSVSNRLRELGIRVALGARRQEVLQAALGRTFRLLASWRNCWPVAGDGSHPRALLHRLSGLPARPGSARRSSLHHASARPPGRLRPGPARLDDRSRNPPTRSVTVQIRLRNKTEGAPYLARFMRDVGYHCFRPACFGVHKPFRFSRPAV